MRLVVTPNGWSDYTYCLAADRQMLIRINRIIDDALRDSVAGIGKPEPLRHLLSGAWSRRITEEHTGSSTSSTATTSVILQARFHYD
ncbi:MAG: Txe/YoeB family addiction module toxin [Actinomycetota bacterium]|nr:Txe/YoeB family addiction module toxin [Actinomycetota bacterium]